MIGPVNHNPVPMPVYRPVDPEAASPLAGPSALAATGTIASVSPPCAGHARPADIRPPLPLIGSTWRHDKSGRVYHVLGFANMRQPGKPGYPPTIRYCDADGHEYAAPLDGWYGRMSWLADPQDVGAPVDPEHIRRVTELLSANSRLVEENRAARRTVKALDDFRRQVTHAVPRLDGLPDGFPFTINICFDEEPAPGERFITAGMIRRAAAAVSP